MLKKLVVWLLKRLYKKTVVKVEVLEKRNHDYYKKLDAFCTLEVPTDHGPFVFHFKEDRRRQRCTRKPHLRMSTYIIELRPPIEMVTVDSDISSKIVVAVKVFLIKPDYDILTQVLVDLYLDSMLAHPVTKAGTS